MATWNCNLSVELGNGFFIFLAVLVGAIVLWHVLLKVEGEKTAADADTFVKHLRRGGFVGRGAM